MNKRKRFVTALCAFAVFCLFSACGETESPVSTETEVISETTPPETVSTPAAEPTPDKTPVLSDGAASDASLSGLFQIGADGTVYSALAEADGLTYLPDLLPEDVSYIAGFLRLDTGFYVSVKAGMLSLDPASIYYYPDEGEPHCISSDVHPGSLFCLSGGALFYRAYDDGSLWRLSAPDAEPEKVVDGDVWLVGADSGFIYYTRGGSVCRNDSTMSAEVPLFDDGGIIRLYAGDDGLCDLTYTADGAALEFRAPDSTLRSTRTLSASSDSILALNGVVYVPDGSSILAFSLSDGTEQSPIELPDTQSSVLLHSVSADALYYRAFNGESFRLYRIVPDGSAPEDLGESTEF